MPCRRDYRCRKLYLCLAFCIAENLPAGSASPVFLISFRCAGGIFLWSMYHIAMCYCHGAGGGLVSVRCGDGDGGGAGGHGGHFAACVYRGDTGGAAFPGHGFIGGVVRRYSGDKGFFVAHIKGQAGLVQLNFGDFVNHAVVQTFRKALVQRAAVHDHVVAASAQAGVFSQRQALTLADDQILL